MYTNLPISTLNPGLVVLLVDQSDSMRQAYGHSTKMAVAAEAVNRCISDIIIMCMSGVKIKDRCHIVVIGYGAATKILVAGRPGALSQSMKRRDTDPPVWVEAEADNGTPMNAAFDEAARVINAWTAQCPDNFPPIVINITDGVPNDVAATVTAAEGVLATGTSDGATLLLNAHISDAGAAEIKLPSDESTLSDSYARLLFGISSVLPPKIHEAAASAGFTPGPNARGFVMNAKVDTLVKLLVFGTSVAR